MTQLGELSLWIALLMATWCVTLAVQGAVLRREPLAESGARGLYVSFAFTVIAMAGLVVAFVRDDFSLLFVATHSSGNMETLHKVCAAWSGAAGEWLLVSLMLGAAASVAAWRALRRDTDRTRAATTVAIAGSLVAAALAATAFGANPFTMVVRAPSDGRGLDPLLRHPLMAVQSPLMMLGLAFAVTGVAISASGLVCRRFGAAWFAESRRMATVAWGMLSAAAILGARWAYVTPGLRALRQGRPSVVAAEFAWLALTLVLAIVELRHAARSPHSEADAMRRRAGRFLVAGGAGLLLLALAARPLERNYDVQIGDGDQYQARDSWGRQWTFTSQGASRLERQGDDVTAVALRPTRGGVPQPYVTSESRQYYGEGGLDIFPAQTVPAIRGSVAQDLVVVLADVGDGRSALRISFRPLVEFAWAGGVLLVFGGLLLFWPPRAEFAT